MGFEWGPGSSVRESCHNTGARSGFFLSFGARAAEHIRRLVLDGTRVVGEQKLTIGQRVRDVRQGPDGYLYVLTDEDDGALLRILAVED